MTTPMLTQTTTRSFRCIEDRGLWTMNNIALDPSGRPLLFGPEGTDMERGLCLACQEKLGTPEQRRAVHEATEALHEKPEEGTAV